MPEQFSARKQTAQLKSQIRSSDGMKYLISAGVNQVNILFGKAAKNYPQH
jgi:hypothetical protein